MNAPRKKETDELRMASAEFDRIMKQALQVKPEKPPKKPSKAKTRKKNSAR